MATPRTREIDNAPFLWLDNDALSILYTYVDLPFALRLTCRQLRDAHPGFTKSRYRDVVSSEPLVSWAIDNGAARHAGGALAEAAAAAGNLPVLQYVHIFTNLVLKRNLTEAAAANGHLAVLRWLRERECPWDEEACNQAAERGHMHILNYAFDNNAPMPERDMGMLLRKAAKHGHMECVRWMHNVKHCALTHATYDGAASGGQLEMLKWMDARDPKLGTRESSIFAADAGSVECLRYLQRRHGWAPIDCAIGAVENKRLNVLRWMTRFTAGRKAMRWATPEEGSLLGKAAFFGYVDIMELLVEHGAVLSEEVTIDAVEGASLEALKWLRARDCPWHSHAFVKAAGWPGSVAVMQWALDNGCPKGAGTDACREAAGQGAVENLQWLRANDFPWCEQVLTEAAESEHLDVLEWARANGCEWSASVTHAAARYNSPDALIWLLKAGCPYTIHELMSLPIVTATWAPRSRIRKLLARLKQLHESPMVGEERWQLLEAPDSEWQSVMGTPPPLVP